MDLGAFSFGLVAGGIWHGIKGVRSAPPGFYSRYLGLVDGVKLDALRTGRSSSIESSLSLSIVVAMLLSDVFGLIWGFTPPTGNFALWGMCFSASECTIRRALSLKPHEATFAVAIVSGGVASSLLTIRRGPSAMAKGFLVGAAVLTVIEGICLSLLLAVIIWITNVCLSFVCIGILFAIGRATASIQQQQQQAIPHAPQQPPPPSRMQTE